MKFKTKYNIVLHKRYFDEGLSITNIVKWFIAFYGASSLNVTNTMWFAIAYVAFCYILGMAYINFGWLTAQLEVENKVNSFVNEVRKKFGIKRKV